SSAKNRSTKRWVAPTCWRCSSIRWCGGFTSRSKVASPMRRLLLILAVVACGKNPEPIDAGAGGGQGGGGGAEGGGAGGGDAGPPFYFDASVPPVDYCA